MKAEEGNKLIMFFYGAEETEIDVMGKMQPAIKWGVRYYTEWGLPPFHNDWSLLMPVVEKINRTRIPNNNYPASVVIWKTTVQISDDYNDIIETNTERTKEKTLIATVWQAVVEFIQWYNKQSKP